ncbi:MAG: DNA-directed DNA polymerase II large subunit [Methanomicrobiales archaeon]|jgi:DNA polymerase II large subunit|nr:DNA-directed DNA polymerase II large subunit [Methanomicrobiales archaeon]
MKISSKMQQYYDDLNAGLANAIHIAQKARSRGFDPKTEIEIPIANDLADRVEAQVGIPGVAQRIRELEKEMSREEASLRIGDDFVARMFGEKNNEEVVEHAIRTAMGILTEGVVSAPVEGIANVSIGKNDDGTEYLKIYYAGPIRSAGGTAQALSVLVGDYVRRALGLNRYIPRPEEIERYIEEIRQYNSIMNLQYLPTEREMRLIINNCPVCIDGEPTEKEQVSGYRNLERVETNIVRGGMALVIAEGLALKAPKVLRNVRKMKMDGWDWLEEIISAPSSAEEEVGVHPKDKYLRDLIGGRPVFSYPMRKGGFRLIYGRSRNTGLAAAGLHPATMHILGDYLAVGTQMKIERPGKAAGISPVDSIQGPTVRLINGDVLRIDDVTQAKELAPSVSKILDVGEFLISYGEFVENNHVLVPCAYCHEWWWQESGCDVSIRPKTEDEALELCENEAYLHPDFMLLWDDITSEEVRELAELIIEHGVVEETRLLLGYHERIKELLEAILALHQIREGKMVISPCMVFLRCLGLEIDTTTNHLILSEQWRSDTMISCKDTLSLITFLSGLKLRSKAGMRIGGRMGRPGKSKPREMSPAPNVLFPVGQGGGNRRSFQKASEYAHRANMDGGFATMRMGHRRCPSCGEVTYKNLCICGTHTEPVLSCPRCGIECTTPSVCPACKAPVVCSKEYTINVKEEFGKALESVGVRKQELTILKGVQGLVSFEKPVELIEKGILRALHNLWVFKDGTVRFDMIDMPLTHFRPREVDVSVAHLQSIGYTHDMHGVPLTDPEQVLELLPQDILVAKSCAAYLIRCAQFMDQLLCSVYGLESFYHVEKSEDLVGHLVIALAPHTSAGVLSRIVGFSHADVGYGHPFFHAAKRRNCFSGETKIEVITPGAGISQVKIKSFILENIDLSELSVDDIGTFYADPLQPIYTTSIDTSGMLHRRKITTLSIHRAPLNMLTVKTQSGKMVMVTPDHAMLVYDISYLRKIQARELAVGDVVPSYVNGIVIPDRVVSLSYDPAYEPFVYCLTVEQDHTVLANEIFTGQCDGDEDCVMLLLDGLINFSRSFLPETRGGSMDAPLVLTGRIDPAEIDKESHNVDVCSYYPLEVYLAALTYAPAKDVESYVDKVEHRLGTPAQVEGFSFTHDTTDISAGPRDTMYTQLKSMADKLDAELALAKIILAVDADDVAERVLQTHFIRDLQGNLNAFSKQKFRCTKCSTSYRRMPLSGKCRCGSPVIPTLHKGSVKKYLAMSQGVCTEYEISEYTRQRVEVIDMNIESTFGQEKVTQLGLQDFM